MKRIFQLSIWFAVLLFARDVKSQTAEDLIRQVKQKLDKVNEYEAKGKLKMNVTFIKAPVATIKVYYKKPDKFRIDNEKGISLIPKGAININLGSLLTEVDHYDIIDAGREAKTNLRIIKLLPKDENSNVVLSTFYIDEKEILVKKAKTTTRENGTYELELTYGKYKEYNLADKVIFIFNTKDYKMPKGVTFDYNDGNSKEETTSDKLKDRKGRVEINYSEYRINQGISVNL